MGFVRMIRNSYKHSIIHKKKYLRRFSGQFQQFLEELKLLYLQSLGWHNIKFYEKQKEFDDIEVHIYVEVEES